MSTSGDAKKTPQFFIFDRIDELESIALELMEKTQAVEPTLKDVRETAHDAYIFSTIALMYQFVEDAFSAPGKARERKDRLLSLLESMHVSKHSLDLLRPELLRICDSAERHTT